MPHAYVFPKIQDEIESVSLIKETIEVSTSTVSEVACTKNEDGAPLYSCYLKFVFGMLWGEIILRELTTRSISGCEDHRMIDSTGSGNTIGPTKEETVWVEGLVPGIDFCNHGV